MVENIKDKVGKIRQETSEVEREVKQRAIGYIAGGFGLVAALAWNDAIRSLIDTVFVIDKNNIWAKFIYAIIITILVTIVTVYLMKLQKKQEEQQNK